METRILTLNSEGQLNKEDLIAAGAVLRSGGLVAFPTETVYGIGANALDEDAIMKIYEAKGRPSDNPLIMHIADRDWLKDYALYVSDKAKALMDAFWPGPLTMVFKKTDKVPNRITGGLDTVAIRMPKHDLARRLIAESGVPVAAPSANISGKPSPTRGHHVISDLSGRVDMIVDGGKSELGLESTVLDVTGDIPCILRPGSITLSMIEEVVGEVTYDAHLKDDKHVPKSPGMKYKHYAPKGHLRIVTGQDEEAIITYINEESHRLMAEGKTVGVITPEHNKEKFRLKIVESIGSVHNQQEIGANLFKILRKMDALEVDEIFSFEFSGDEVSVAIMNRLNKAAGNHIIRL